MHRRPLLAATFGCALALAAVRGAAAMTVVVTADKADVMVGTKVVATVAKGQTFDVAQVKDVWYGIHVKVADKAEMVFGWIHSRNVEVKKATPPGGDPLEAEAEKELKARRDQAEKLAAEGKFDDAVALFDKFPQRYWGTKAGKKARDYGAEFDQRRHAKPENLEAAAEAEFKKRKADADKLAAEGKLADAVQTMAGYPARYEKTKWFEEARKARLELAERASEAELAKAKARADKLAAEGKTDEAVKVLDEFLRQYEGTKAVEAAGRHKLEIVERARTVYVDFEKKVLELMDEGKFDEALAEVKALEDKKPAGKEAYLKAARAFVELHKKAAATPKVPVASDDCAADVYGKDAEFGKQLSRILQIRGPAGTTSFKVPRIEGGKIIMAEVNLPKPAEQITFGEQLVHTYPWSPNVRYYLAKLHARTGVPAKAVARFAEARALDRGVSVVTLDSFVEAARVLTRDKKYAEAVELLKGALARKPDDFIALTTLGRTHLAAGAKADAAAALEKSLKINPHQPHARRLLAEAKGQKLAEAPPPKLALTELFKQVEESCVIITANRSSGSGYVIHADGIIATNFHVIAPGGKLGVRYKRKGEFVTIPDVQLVLGDPVSDVAILKVDARAFPLKPLPLGSAKDVASGEDIVVVGNPGLAGQILDYTITKGIISNRDRVFNNIHFFQTDAAVNPGNSGGPLFNMSGQVIGTVTLGTHGMQGTGFASHIEHVKAHFPNCFPDVELE